MSDDQPNATPESVAETTPSSTPPISGPEQAEAPKSGPDHAAEARKWEKRSKDNHKALEDEKNARKASEDRLAAVLKAVGATPEDNEDPTELAQRLTGERDTATRERDEALTRVKSMERERRLERAAHAAGADVSAFMDSRSVLADLADLDDDADDSAYTALVKKRLEASPHLATTPSPRVPAPNRAQGTSGSTVKATGVSAGAALFDARRGKRRATTPDS